MVNRPRGTRDFGPDEMTVRNWAADRLSDVFRRYGYRQVQTPTFEDLELFTAKSGPAIEDELYAFQDKGGRDVCLRPELTAPVMRMYFADHAFDPKPVKWFYFGNCFRYDRPQAGRYREFWQFGCEQIGAGTPLAYAELIALADAMFRELGLEDYDLRVGHVGILGGLVDALGLPDEARGRLMRLIDKGELKEAATLCADAGAGRDAIDALLEAIGARSLAEAEARIGDDPGARQLKETMEALHAMGVDARLDLGIARGLDYYTGIVFEVHAEALGSQSQLLGGGGYDLSSVFDAQETPSMGFGLGFDRTLAALQEEAIDVPAEERTLAYFGALGEKARGWTLETVRRLRDDRIPVEMDLMERRPGQVAKAADAAGARYLIIVGDRELEKDHVEAKELKTGETEPVALDDLQHWLLSRIGRIEVKDAI